MLTVVWGEFKEGKVGIVLKKLRLLEFTILGTYLYPGAMSG